jgi:hypothetical protein
MKVRPTSPLFESIELDAIVSEHHPRCCYGKPVLVLTGNDGGAVGPPEAEFAGYEVIEATDDERHRLLIAGYHLKGLEHTQLAHSP